MLVEYGIGMNYLSRLNIDFDIKVWNGLDGWIMKF